MTDFLNQLKTTIDQYSLIQEHEKVLVAVSGGPDSMALLHGLLLLSQIHKKDWRFSVIHVNHLLRGEDSEGDARYVANFCRQRQLPYTICRVDVPRHIQKDGGNQQAIARKLRYQAFYETAKHRGITKIALAHHADDQIETVLMRILRGTGVAGLKGMECVHEWRGLKFIRPLLNVFRSEIERYLQENELVPREDQTNRETYYTRNRIRHHLIPELCTYNPKAKKAFLQLTDIVTHEEDIWNQLTKDALSKVLVKKNQANYWLDVTKFLDLPVALQRRTVKLILDCLAKKKATAEMTLEIIDHVRKLAAHHHPSAEAHIAGGILIKKEYERLHITYLTDHRLSHPVAIPLNIPGTTKLPDFHGEIEAFLVDQNLKDIELNHEQVVLDADKISQPLMVRSRKKGDRIHLFGMEGSKKVKELFMEAKIPRDQRDSYPIVATEQQIIWIPGIRRSSYAPISKDTKIFLYLIWKRFESFFSRR